MCGNDDHDHGHDEHEAILAAPRAIGGLAIDPIDLEPVDEVRITTLMDNSYDGLLGDTAIARRAGLARVAQIAAANFEGGTTAAGLIAEHGFSALVTTRRGDESHTVLFDTGVSPNGLSDNLERLGLQASQIEAVVLSHGHFDHAGGFEGLARLRGRSGLPITVHPKVWTKRRVAVPGLPEWELPALSRTSLESEGFEIVERRQPSLVLGGQMLITGEIDRTTDFERGMPFHEQLGPDGWEPDPEILDDQALVVNVRGLGLLVLTGCGHAGVVNICRYAGRLTGVEGLAAVIGGFHLSGPAFEPIITPTIEALQAMRPQVIVPAHCTGWRAQHRLAADLPDAFVPNAVGTTITLCAA